MMRGYDYIEDHADAPVSSRLARAKREIHFNVKLRSIPVGNPPLRTECRVPAQNFVRERFPDSRNGKVFKDLQAENQRKHDIALARGNIQLSRTSGDWHPITQAEISAIIAAEEALKMYPENDPKNGPTPKRTESDLLTHRKIQHNREVHS